MHAPTELIVELAVVIVAALLAAMAARALKLPVLIGYLVVGVVLGPSGFGVVRDSAIIRLLAEIGVALLMFTIGIELSLGWLSRLKHAAFICAPLQIIGTAAFGYLAGTWLGWNSEAALIFGFALSLSSTMVVVKLLTHRGELQKRYGEAMVAILIIQDLAAVVMVAIIPALSQMGEASVFTLVQLVIKGVAFLVWVVVLAWWLVPALMRVVVRSYSKEVFVITAAALCLGGAASGHLLGFSLALGAFAAGLVISESPYGHELTANIIPLRDLFGLVFFVSLGLLFNVSEVWRQSHAVLVLLACILVGKPVITAVAMLIGGYWTRSAVAAGLGLAQVGEFSFLVITLAWQQKVIPPQTYSLLIAVAIVSLLLTPLWMQFGRLFYRKLCTGKKRRELTAWAGDRGEVEIPPGHVLLCGYGRIGGRIGERLLKQGYPFVVVEFDQHVINELDERDVPTVFGDASSAVVLEAAGAAQARLAVLALPEGGSTRLAVRELRRINPSLPIIVRVHSDEEVEAVSHEGAARVIYAEWEAGLEMVRDTLLLLGEPPDEVSALVDRERSARPVYWFENGGKHEPSG